MSVSEIRVQSERKCSSLWARFCTGFWILQIMYNDDVTCTVADFGRRCKALGLNCGEAVCRWFSIHTYPVDVKSNFDGVQIKPEVTVLGFFFPVILWCFHIWGYWASLIVNLAIDGLSYPHCSSSTEVWMTPCRPPRPCQLRSESFPRPCPWMLHSVVASPWASVSAPL